MRKVFLLLPLLWIMCLLPFHKGEAKDPKDRLSLSFTKTVFIKKYKNLKVHYERHTVKKGEFLWKIMKDKYGIPPSNLPEFLRIVKVLNPSIANLNTIYQGQKLYIPIRLETQAARSKPPSSFPTAFVTVKEHTVQPGQTLAGILLHVYNVPKALVFNEHITLFRELNPSIKDLNLLRVHQKILVPVHEPIPEEKRKLAKKRTPKPLITKEINTEERLKFLGGVKGEVAPSELERAIPMNTESGPEGVKNSVGALFKTIGDRYINKGSYYIPIPGGGELTVDTASFPILELKSGRKVIIDLDDGLPAKIEKLIESNWKNYKIVNIQRDESAESIFNKLFSLAGYYSVTGGDDPLVLRGKISIKIWADWMVFKDKDRTLEDLIYAVNIIGKEDKEVPLAIKDYLERFGVRVIDVSLGGKPESDQREGIIRGEEEVVTLNSSTHRELIHGLLTLIGQPFTEGVKVPLLKTGSSGFNLEITADIFLKRGDRNSIISLHTLPNDLVKMLIENEFRILEVDEGESRESVISKVLSFLGIEFSSSTFEFDTGRKGDPHNISIAIPGFLFQENSSLRVLLTEANLDKNINRFLKGMGVRTVKY
ncbi:MAG: LysM domain-containing protein [Pseudomonadota bacterium]